MAIGTAKAFIYIRMATSMKVALRMGCSMEMGSFTTGMDKQYTGNGVVANALRTDRRV